MSIGVVLLRVYRSNHKTITIPLLMLVTKPFSNPPPTTTSTNYARGWHPICTSLWMWNVEMQDNYNHGVNCTLVMADWSLCYIQYVLIDYWGDEDYLDPNFQIYFSSIHCVLQDTQPRLWASACYGWPNLHPTKSYFPEITIKYESCNTSCSWILVSPRDR